MDEGYTFHIDFHLMDVEGYWNIDSRMFNVESYKAIALVSLHHQSKQLKEGLEKERKNHEETKRRLAQRDSLIRELEEKSGVKIDEKKDEKIYGMKKEMKKMSKNMKKAMEEMEEAKEETKKARDEKEKLEKQIEDDKVFIRNIIEKRFVENTKPKGGMEEIHEIFEDEVEEEVFEEEVSSGYFWNTGEVDEYVVEDEVPAEEMWNNYGPAWSDGTETVEEQSQPFKQQTVYFGYHQPPPSDPEEEYHMDNGEEYYYFEGNNQDELYGETNEVYDHQDDQYEVQPVTFYDHTSGTQYYH